jgi:hypothetical protein
MATPPNLIACTHNTVIRGAPTKHPSVLASITMPKSLMSECSRAMRDDLTSDIVKTGSDDPKAYMTSAAGISLVFINRQYNYLPASIIQNLKASATHNTPTTETRILISAPRMLRRISEPCTVLDDIDTLIMRGTIIASRVKFTSAFAESM